ncbi:hypothetical protein [Catenuloplanes indicus]|uniref:hypothetical protein n=1 Tax=Catenuloplanes indicus TaxID=137267 RepID=UPI003522D37B
MDTHLHSIFAKLGVRSRRELRDMYREAADGGRSSATTTDPNPPRTSDPGYRIRSG